MANQIEGSRVFREASVRNPFIAQELEPYVGPHRMLCNAHEQLSDLQQAFTARLISLRAWNDELGDPAVKQASIIASREFFEKAIGEMKAILGQVPNEEWYEKSFHVDYDPFIARFEKYYRNAVLEGSENDMSRQTGEKNDFAGLPEELNRLVHCFLTPIDHLRSAPVNRAFNRGVQSVVTHLYGENLKEANELYMSLLRTFGPAHMPDNHLIWDPCALQGRTSLDIHLNEEKMIRYWMRVFHELMAWEESWINGMAVIERELREIVKQLRGPIRFRNLAARSLQAACLMKELYRANYESSEEHVLMAKRALIVHLIHQSRYSEAFEMARCFHSTTLTWEVIASTVPVDPFLAWELQKEALEKIEHEDEVLEIIETWPATHASFRDRVVGGIVQRRALRHERALEGQAFAPRTLDDPYESKE